MISVEDRITFGRSASALQEELAGITGRPSEISSELRLTPKEIDRQLNGTINFWLFIYLTDRSIDLTDVCLKGWRIRWLPFHQP